MKLSANIKRFRKQNGMSIKDLGDAVGVSASAVGMWEQGRREPKPALLIKIAEALNCTTSELLGDMPARRTEGVVAVPILGEVAAGYPMYAEENILGYEEIASKWATQGEIFALKIKGDSMLPRMRDGDIVIVRRQSTCNDGQTAVVLVNGETATVKRVQIRDDGLMLIPTNPEYAPMFYSARSVQTLPVTIIGVVVELRARYV